MNSYLKGFGFSQLVGKEFGFSTQVSKDDFLPENMVYRLGFKANNETAQKIESVHLDV